ncbi:hypothetical protein BGZ95_005333, partial [Linnemannia exigua]
MNSSSSFGFLPYQTTASQITSPGAQAHPQQQQHHHQQQQPHQQQQHPHQQTLSQQQLSHELAQELSSPPPLSLHASSLHSSTSTAASLSGSSTSPISVSSGTLLSSNVHANGGGPGSNTNNQGTGNNTTHGGSPGLVGGHNGNNSAAGSPTGVGPTAASSLGGASQHGGHPTINTAMLSSYGGMLSSPPHSSSQAQSSSNSSTPGSILTTPPHQTADLDTILATFSSQPELLKMIIASKTEEDRRWAEEARFKMMDLMLRENRGGMNLMTGYEGLLAQAATSPNATGTPGSSITTENMGGHPSTATATTTTTTSVVTTHPSSTSTIATLQTPTSSLGLSSTGKRFMDDDDFDTPSSASLTGGFRGNGALGGLGGVSIAAGGAGGGGFSGQGPDHGLARKRSVTFARDIHHGHLRSQSMSSMPSGPHSISTVTSTPLSNPSNQFGTLSMLGLTGPNTALQQHTPSSFQQYPQPPSSGPLTLQQQYQQQQPPPHQPHQAPHHQQTHQFPQHQHQTNQHLPPQFGQYPQMFSYHTTLPQLQHQNVIRRTNSLSHLSQFAQSSPHSLSGGASLLDQQRLAAGRPRNVSSSSLRTQDDSDDESDEDYSDHPVMGGMNSRPGSSLSMNNMMGGNGETSLTLEFSDLASVSGPSGLGQGGYSHHHQQQQQSSHHHQQSYGHNSTMSMTMAALGPGAITSTGLRPTSGSMSSTLSSGGGGGGNTSGGGADAGGGIGGVDQKRKRKRREMQPVNKIVDSAEPHIDQFLWKNNGNTTQKKTGCKSIYYKCSNSANGCT